MSDRRHHPLPPDAPHAHVCLAPGWWVLPLAIANVIFWGALILLLI
jgi:hypothetical protein